ncbi:AraC family transcriptional regulator [Paenibacillus sp. HB172176]|uniref:helix-turn-helix domain-containing protein n=1 Tax=Paenibacillus sp. HB172176 TaxID=2493690 RepID=UPI00143CA81B|nr:AraC family transcriptional regulator [Paenibacillus sp. HB172176]
MLEMSTIDVLTCNHAVHIKPFSGESHLSCYLIRYQTEGSSRIRLNHVLYEQHQGDLLLCRPGDHYTLEDDASPDARCADYFIRCNGEALDQWWDKEYSRLITVGIDDQLMHLFQHIIYEQRRQPRDESLIQHYYLRILLLTIKRLRMHPSTHRYAPYHMKEYIEKRATESLKLSEVAAAVNLGVSRASELFKSTFHCSIIQYVIQIRLTLAKERILYDDLPLEDVAYSCGFHSYAHFSRMFTRHVGESPGSYRQRNR